MTDLSWIFSSGFLGMRFYDLPNFMICALFVLLAGRSLKVPALYQGILLLHCLLPFVLNGVLFSYDYMPDALKYWHSFNAIRAGEIGILDAWLAGNVSKAAVLFSVMPFPFAVTPISLGFHNAFLFSALFYWLYRKQVFTPASAWFFLLYPSLALYTGMGLRDTLIFVFMIVAIQWAREGRWWLSLIPLYFLYAIKFQNFFILGPVLLIYVAFGIRKTGVSVSRGLLTVGVSVLSLVAVSPFALPLVNGFRGAMWVEDGGDIKDIEFIETPTQFILEGLTSALYFILKPLPWEAGNALQLVQSVENLAVGAFLVMITVAAWRRVPKKLIFWLLFMAFALSIYGLVVFNYGTAARYRYPFIVIFVLFVCADCHVRSVFKPFAPAHWRVGRRRVASGGDSSLS